MFDASDKILAIHRWIKEIGDDKPSNLTKQEKVKLLLNYENLLISREKRSQYHGQYPS